LLTPPPPRLPEQATLSNTLLAVPVLFVLYDLFYSLFHRALHIKSVYSLVHKHHHRQHAPSRGAVDALNVHPFEFVCGEYNHLLALWLTQRLLGSVHVAAVLVFIVAGGAAASLNHTRLDVRLPLGTYAVRAHDVHHRLPRSNYGQYTQVWDRLLGTYREWNPPTGKAEGKAQ
jgi:sterol desaturase/sphingolipid hydroxylase (fatty acid hydroxylase superfamily)